MRKTNIKLMSQPANPTGIQPGQIGHLLNAMNPVIAIGEDHIYLWVILARTGEYYGVLKHAKNLSALKWDNFGKEAGDEMA